MRRKLKTEKQKEAKKKAAERMRHYKDLKEKPKQKKKRDKSPDTGSNMVCVEYVEKNVVNGDDDWHKRFYYYEKKKPTGEKFEI